MREHHRKLKKEARKAKKNGLPVKKMSKITKIPNLYPGKIKEMKESEIIKELDKLAEQEKKNRKKEKKLIHQEKEN